MAITVNENGTIKTLGGESVDFIAYRGTKSPARPFNTDEYPSFLYKELVFDNLVQDVMYSKNITLPFAPRLLVIFPATYGNSDLEDTLCLHQGEGVESNTGSSISKAGNFFTDSNNGYGLYLQGTTLTVKYRTHSVPSIPKTYFLANIFIIG